MGMFDQDFDYVEEDGSPSQPSAEDVELDFERKFAKGSLYRLCLKSGCLKTPDEGDEEEYDEATLQLIDEINEEFKQWVRRQMGVLLNGTEIPSGGQSPFTSEEVSAIKSLVGRFTDPELVALKAWADKLLTKDPSMAVKAVATPVATQAKATVKPAMASVKTSAAPKTQPKPKAKGSSTKEPAKGEKVAKKGALRFQKKEVAMPDGSTSATFTPAPREKLKTHIPFPSREQMEAITFQASQKQIDSHNRNQMESRVPTDSEGNSNITKF